MNRFVLKAIRGSKLSACALAVAGVFFIGSQAMAQAPTQIFACVNKNSGQTFIVAQNATCPVNSSLVVWNVVGPQGPIGPQGAQGPAGPAGAQGPSNAFLADNSQVFGSKSIASGDNFTPLLTLSLPPGSYVVNAVAALASNTTGLASLPNVDCAITSTNQIFVLNRGTMAPSPNSGISIPVTTAFTLTASDNVSLACRSGQAPVTTQASSIVAIQVATLTKQLNQ
jgi:hypothetical protein